MNEEKIGKFISELRKNKNLTQKELASILNVTDKAISRWETGKGLPDITMLIPLSEALEISVNELLKGEKTKTDKSTEEALKNIVELSKISMKNKEKTIKYIVTLFTTITLILLYLSNSLSPIGVLEILLITFILLTLKFKKTKKKHTLIINIILLTFTAYSFLTYTGSVRLQILLMGHPIKAYQTDLKEKPDRRTPQARYYQADTNIQVVSGSIGLTECKNYFGIKISSYYGF